MPRATTAACEVLPPRLVRTPRAAIMPCRSSGVVSRRTRMTSSPRSALDGRARVEDGLADGRAGRGAHALGEQPCAPPRVELGEHQPASCVAGDPRERLVLVDEALVDQLAAIRNAAAAVRLPTRVCSIQSLPRSMVNSMSHRSR